MSDTTDSSLRGPWPTLGIHERRVLGVLVEKAKTTPDAYPMSLNGLVTGCNQKSNRDPLLNLNDDEVEAALIDAQKKQLAIKIIGSGRIDRWRHALYDVWKVNKVELAVLGELLLRGPQTEGELRGRASRMEPIEDVDALRPVLQTLAQRGLVVYLTPEGRRGTTLTHGFHAPEELERLRAAHGASAGDEGPATPRQAPAPAVDDGLRSQLAEARRDIESLRNQVESLQAQVADLARQVHKLKEALGA